MMDRGEAVDSNGVLSQESIDEHAAIVRAESNVADEASSTAKSKRYDRQLRIWGAEGQQRLESCKLCLLNAGPTGSETLKNLVLGGIGSFTIVDGQKVEPSDMGNNFMIEASRFGESRAKAVTDLVKELNELVAGSYVEESPESMLERSPQFFAQFTVVVATQMREPDLIKLDDVCREHGVTLVVVRSYGLAGMLRVSIREHQIVESKPDNIVDDLRLHEPFPELQQFADSFDLNTLDDVTLHHVPYVVLLMKAAAAWRSTHDGQLPNTSKQRAEFKEAMMALRRMAGEVPIDSENFEEAVKAAFHVWTKYSIGSEVRAVLADECATDAAMGPQTPDFWIMVAALRRFLQQEGGGQYLPLDGNIPDMHATTELFQRTQRVYRKRADQDAAAVQAHVRQLLAQAGRDPDSIPRDKICTFCKNARNLRVVRYHSLRQEFSNSGGAKADVITTGLASEGTAAAAALYVLLRAVDRFYTQHGRFPGTTLESELEEDMPGMKTATQQLLAEIGAGSAVVPDDYVLEMVRFGASELHVVAAFMGGMAAQEIIKLVTCQFTTVPGTFIYNGIGATTASFEV